MYFVSAEDLNSLLAIDEPKVDLPPRTTRSKSKTPSRRGRSRGNKRACVEESTTSEPEESTLEVKRSKEESRNTIGVNAYCHFITRKKANMAGKRDEGIDMESRYTGYQYG